MQAQLSAETSIRPVAASPSAVDDEILLNSAQARALVGGVSSMCLWRWTRDERVQFPAPDMVINRRKYWKAATIRRWKSVMAAKTVENNGD